MRSESAIPTRPVKHFPLQLYEVLEAEFVSTHGSLSIEPGWLLTGRDICYPKLIEYLRTPLQMLSGRAVAAIKEKLEAAGVAIPIDGAGSEELEALLLLRLNQALQSNTNLYDHALIERDTIAWQFAQLHAKHVKANTAQRASGSASPEQMQLNRLLLEAAFPADAIARIETVRLNALFKDIQNLQGPDGIRSALCLSGGGIRSAAFGLGVLSGLARHRYLEKFDYLSTVSGGGYVGSWLSTWVNRHPQGLSGVTEELSRRAKREPGDLSVKIEPAPEPIRFLRSYSHFLNPKSGIFSPDTWGWIGIYLRNLSLNWLVIIPLLLLLAMAPRLYMSAASQWKLEYGVVLYGGLFPLLVWIASFAVLLTLVCITVNRPSINDPVTPGRGNSSRAGHLPLAAWLRRFNREPWILGLGAAPIFVFGVVLTLLVWGLPRGQWPLTWAQVWVLLYGTSLLELPSALAHIGFDHLLLWGEILVFGGWLISVTLLPRKDSGKRFLELWAMLFAGLLTWALVAALADYAAQASGEGSFHLFSFTAYAAHLYAVFAVPAVVTATLAGMTLFIGAVSKFKWVEDEDREWWARFGAWMLVGIVAWIAVTAITVFGPPLLLDSPRMIGGIGGLSGLIALLLGRSSLTSATKQKSEASGAKKKPVSQMAALAGVNTLAVASAIFLAVLLAFLSLVSSALLDAIISWHRVQDQVAAQMQSATPEGAFAAFIRAHLPSETIVIKSACGQSDALTGPGSLFSNPQAHLELICQTPLWLVSDIMALLAVLLLAASLLINLNKFSLHAAYRIRIVRTFLGASRGSERRPNPFTGFDPLDNVQMHELQPGLLRERDIVHLPSFVAKLHAALTGGKDSPAAFIVQCMCSTEFDRYGILQSRLRSATPGRPVLRALQRDVLETLNQVLESVRLDHVPVFEKLSAVADHQAHLAALDQYIRHGNIIFSNRLLIEAAFPEEIRKYEFPPPPPHKLMHVINLTLNLVHGERLAWQERKAAPFIVTPMHAGTYYLGYRESRRYGGEDGLSIGTAVAISGAAVSPNMGYSSSPLTALLLTLFNVRLGWWLGNPGAAGASTYFRAEPKLSLRPLLSEALGLTDDRSPYVYLSDGGHFENMGLFEMVLRRCRLIVATDAGADPDYQFDDLGNAVRKIRIDLGIAIEFDSIPIHRMVDGGDSGRYCAVGRIRYSCVDGPDAPDGVLVCFKPVLCGKEPRDVLNYAAQNNAFPQEPTANQFFGESQFEAYRQLGEFAVETAFTHASEVSAGEAESSGTARKAWAQELVEAVRAHLSTNCEKCAWLEEWIAGRAN
jgi:Patatin-like phospholipase